MVTITTPKFTLQCVFSCDIHFITIISGNKRFESFVNKPKHLFKITYD